MHTIEYKIDCPLIKQTLWKWGQMVTIENKIDCPLIKQRLWKWGQFERTKSIFKILPVSWVESLLLVILNLSKEVLWGCGKKTANFWPQSWRSEKQRPLTQTLIALWQLSVKSWTMGSSSNFDWPHLCSPFTYRSYITCMERSKTPLYIYEDFKRLVAF